ncbi:hypothetical protein Pla22_03480 [Rubripirellula amarantea]|uniref:Uncharacterized protein n=1 Tax=Rubripirellula amarantea TaxID=2527999 RepID=A0A5C5WSG4_9BACT|nr:hypothetical protein Pla22_03480 [Rubripirellula amarantea]
MRFEQPIAVITRRMVFAMVREIKAISLRNDVKGFLGAHGLYSTRHAMSWAYGPTGSIARGSVTPGSWCNSNGQPTTAISLLASGSGLLGGKPSLFGWSKRTDTRQHQHLLMLTSCPASSAEPSSSHTRANRMVG